MSNNHCALDSGNTKMPEVNKGKSNRLPVQKLRFLVSRKLWLARAQLRAAITEETGAVTAEYAIVIMAAVAFAGLLVVIMRSGQVQELLTQLVQNALGSVS